MPQVQLQGPLTSCVWLGGQERPQGWGAASRTSGLPCCRSASQQVPCPPIHYFEEAMGHRSFVTCPDSGTKQWVMKMARGLKVSKSKIGFNAVQENKERILGKQHFAIVWRLKPGSRQDSCPSVAFVKSTHILSVHLPRSLDKLLTAH